nr:hypothetical protein [uncultured Acetatifactor sp.]
MGRFPEDEVRGIILVNITNLARNGDCSWGQGSYKRLRRQMRSRYSENVMLAVGADMNQTASTLEVLGECNVAILVEERGK